MNKKGQLGQIIYGLFALIVIIVLLQALGEVLLPKKECPQCPICDYSTYENRISQCILDNQNLTKTLEERPVINNTIYVPQYIDRDKIEVISSIFIIPIATLLSILLFFKLHLFKIEIKLPNEVEEEIIKYKRLIKISKIIAFVLSILLIIKLILLL